MQVVSSSDVLEGPIIPNEDLTYNADWQIWPTSVNLDPTSGTPSQQLRQINNPHNILPADIGGISSFLRRGKDHYETPQAMSRDEVILDLLEPAEVHGRKVHVEDFLWTGSGKNTSV